MSVTISTNYTADLLDQVLMLVTTKNQMVEKGVVCIIPNVKGSIAIPRLKTSGQFLQKRVAQPATSDAKGTLALDEKKLTPKDMMVYTEFNPRAFEAYWRQYQPTGNLVFSQLPPAVQAKLVEAVTKAVDFEFGERLINSTEDAGAREFFDGLVARAIDNTSVIDIAAPAALTDANILAIMELIHAAIPVALRGNPNLRILISPLDADKYDNALTALATKGADPTTTNALKYKNIQFIVLNDMPENTIICTICSPGYDGNLFAAVSMTDDADTLLIDKVSNAGENYFIKILMKADFEIAFGEEMVMYRHTA